MRFFLHICLSLRKIQTERRASTIHSRCRLWISKMTLQFSTLIMYSFLALMSQNRKIWYSYICIEAMFPCIYLSELVLVSENFCIKYQCCVIVLKNAPFFDVLRTFHKIWGAIRSGFRRRFNVLQKQAITGICGYFDPPTSKSYKFNGLCLLGFNDPDSRRIWVYFLGDKVGRGNFSKYKFWIS